MTDCTHDLTEREVACADGMCPMCLAAENDALRADAETWRHIAQEHYSLLRRALDPDEIGYAIEGSLDALFRSYRKNGKYSQVFCSQCGRAFLHHNYHGYSHCEEHAVIDAALAGEKP